MEFKIFNKEWVCFVSLLCCSFLLNLGNMIVARSRAGVPITADDLGVSGAVTGLLLCLLFVFEFFFSLDE